ncbi:MAG TPA: ABC transporter permease subunit [Streptosporangiaceae bacterium]|nr:ABC transporter permease subunit [Streptosporangiaceae bacterium]
MTTSTVAAGRGSVSPALTIAALTITEALRRRLVLAFIVITAAVVGLSAWGFNRLAHHPGAGITSGEVNVAMPTSYILFMFMFSFVVALSASAIASPAISGEVDSGVLHAVAARPVRRAEILLGKWLGLAALLAAYTAVVCGLEYVVVYWSSGYLAPDPVPVGAYLFAEGAVLLTLVLLLSTRLPTLAAGVIGVAVFGITWLGGVVGTLGTGFHVTALTTASKVVAYVVPTNGLWQGAVYYLEPQNYIIQQLVTQNDRGDPFFSAAAPSAGYLAWAGVWFVLVLGAGVISFGRREL